MTKTKVVDLKKLCSFVVDNFFLFEIIYAWKILFEFLIIEIWIFKTTSDEETTKTKVVDLEKFCNFVVNNFFSWNQLCMENYAWISYIWNLNLSNELGWRNNKNKSYRSQKVMQLYSWRFFNLSLYRDPNTHFKFRCA